MGAVHALLTILLGFSTPADAAQETHALCPRVRLLGRDPGFSEVEKRLLCGDSDSDGWKEVPLSQARHFMTAFLQSRGYHFPKFQTEGETMLVDVGTRTFVRQITGSGTEGIFDIAKRRKIVGEALTPGVLDKAREAIAFELQSRGYACPKVQLSADARTGLVRASVAPGPVYTLSGIEAGRVEKVDPGVFSRFEAFEPGIPFDIRLLSLTSERIKQDALFLSAYYDVACSSTGLKITQRVIEGPPHLITVGVGLDTEGLVHGRARVRQSRIGYRASSAEASVFASKLEQSINGFMHYYLSPSERTHLRPAGFFRREDEVQYQAARSQVSLSPAWTHDGEDLHLEVRGGPSGNYFDTIEGLGPAESIFFGFGARAQIMTHLYEYYARDPRRGWMAELETFSRLAGAGSELSEHRVLASGESLWNLGKFDPPVAILATRGLLGTTWTADPPSAFTRLPPTERFFLGGDATLRGFQRKRLPDEATGFLTVAYQGVELRAGDILPYNLQPLVFIDAGMGGVRHFHLDSDVYYSPGFGVRWGSPVGAVRATLARGLVWRASSPVDPPKPRWQFFFSFGREF